MKSTKVGNAALQEVQNKMASSKNLVVVSKDAFQRGFHQKDEAYMDLYKVSAEAAVQAAIAARTFQQTKNPMQKAACVASLDPLIVVIKDVPVMLNNEREFSTKTTEIGKKYNIPMPKPNQPTPKSVKFNGL
jgi:hypothetical protein